jgi:cytidine deaminase
MASNIESQLIEAATRTLEVAHRNEDHHTVASAAMSSDGRIFTGVNIFHFTGGPCAEMVAIGVAVAVSSLEIRCFS